MRFPYLKQSIYFCLAVIITLGISISTQALLANWINPTAIPPDNNLSKPINVSEVTQFKLGNLGVGANFIPNEKFEVRDDTASTSRIRITDLNQNS
ncbi:MAG: hypothetical protein Q7T79_00125, partial [bacterium]|nr:hypothetical protein [bacterium]